MNLRSTAAGSGEELLMIHGIISDGSFFAPAANILKNKYRVVVYDRRGYGDSEDGEDHTVEAQARDAAQILEEHGGSPAWILGNSAGGLIAAELALERPDLVRGLILLEPSLVFDDESRKIIREWNAELNGYVAERRIKKALPAFSRVMCVPEGMSSGGTMEEMKRTYKNLSAFMYGELNDIQNYRPAEETMRSLSVPVRVIVTEDGKDSIFASTSRSGAEILGWKTVTVPGYHNVIKDMPEMFSEKLDEIIGEMRDELQAL